MKKLALIAPVLIAGISCAPSAAAATAYMNGIFNVGPGWSTITMPDGSRCAEGCSEVKYNTWDLTPKSATAAAGAWMDANNTPDSVLYVYSMSSVGAIDARAARPDWQGQIVALGSPAKPLNGASHNDGGRAPLDVNGGSIQFVTSADDSVATRNGGMGHTTSYKGRDFSHETPVSDTQVTPSTRDTVYAAPPKKPSWLSQIFAPTKASNVDNATVTPAKKTFAEKVADRKAERKAKLDKARQERKEKRDAAKSSRVVSAAADRSSGGADAGSSAGGES